MKVEKSQREIVKFEIVDDIPAREDPVLLSILQVDPDTGYPATSLESVYEKVNDPEIREYIRQRLNPVVGEMSRTDNPDEAIEMLPGIGESRIAYAQRVRDYILNNSKSDE